MANKRVLSVIAVARALVVEGLYQVTAICLFRELRLQLANAFRVVMEAVEQRTGVKDTLVAVGGGDGDEIVSTDIHGGYASLVAGIRGPCCVV